MKQKISTKKKTQKKQKTKYISKQKQTFKL